MNWLVPDDVVWVIPDDQISIDWSFGISGEDFWEDVEGDLVLPPLIKKKLKGRPTKMRRREGWKGVVSSGKKVRVSYEGRVLDCGLCREADHKRGKCPNKDKFPENSKKRNRGKKTHAE
ncbi:hypothetical protein AgCh_018807 [Apium graveolens]